MYGMMAKGFGKAAKGPYGKGDGKGKAKGPSGPQCERERLTAEKFAGTVADWRGKFGYIQPAEPIDHPNAAKKQGKLWVSQTDLLSGAGELAVGTECSFHIYNDSTGMLGAEEVEDFGAPAGAAKPAAAFGKAGGKSFGKAAAAPAGMAAGMAGKGKMGGMGMKGGAWGMGGGSMGAGWGMNMAAKGGGMGAMGAKGGYGAMGAKGGMGAMGAKGAAKGGKDGSKGGKGKRQPGHLLERDRLTADKFSGEVVAWKGKFGYIQPAEPIDHPNAAKSEGKIWVSISDCPDQTELAVGTQVAFHVYTDKTGVLGAEEVDA